MKKEYDFSKGEQGKFFVPGAELSIPVYLDSDNYSFVEQLAEKSHSDLSTVVNQLLRSDRGSGETVP